MADIIDLSLSVLEALRAKKLNRIHKNALLKPLGDNYQKVVDQLISSGYLIEDGECFNVHQLKKQEPSEIEKRVAEKLAQLPPTLDESRL